MGERREHRLDFVGSPRPTIGVEVELQIIDPATRRLANAAPRILKRFPGSSRVKPEMVQAQVELNTEICHDIDHVRQDLGARLEELHAVCDDEGLVVAGTGTHPLSPWSEVRVSEDARYQGLADRMQWLGRRFVIYGLHVHVGVPDGERAIAVCKAFSGYLPLLLGLTASSPFWQGRDSGLASTRVKIFEALHTAGLPFDFSGWDEFRRYVAALVEACAIESVREVWWDVRPHPGFGTVEVRICDGVNTLSEIVAVAALVQSLVVWLGERYEARDPLPSIERWIVRENKWRACRWGSESEMIVDDRGTVAPFETCVERVLAELAPVARRLGSLRDLERVPTMLRHPSYKRQRAVYSATSSLQSVVDSNVLELRQDEVA